MQISTTDSETQEQRKCISNLQAKRANKSMKPNVGLADLVVNYSYAKKKIGLWAIVKPCINSPSGFPALRGIEWSPHPVSEMQY